LAEQIAGPSWPLTGSVWQAGVTCRQERPARRRPPRRPLGCADGTSYVAEQTREAHAQVIRSPEAELLAEHDLPLASNDVLVMPSEASADGCG
jgi:hypothetical protein